MWDSNAPLQLLKSMPKKLGKEHLEKIQLVLEADKYKNSLVSGFDLCGMYAPFCRGCKKTSIYPCAIAYVNMKKSEGMDIEIDAKPVIGSDNKEFGQPVPANTEIHTEAEIAVTAAETEVPALEAVEVKPVEEETVQKQEPEAVTPEEPKVNAPVQKSVKRRIRIAVARKKI